MKIIPLTQGKFSLVDDEDFDRISSKRWYLQSKGYAREGKHLSNLYLHRYVLNLKDKNLQVDHINGNKLDNRKENLRICTNQQNHWNTKAQKSSSSGIRGVYFDPRRKGWIAQAKIFGHITHLGTFEDSLSATRFRDLVCKVFRGDFHKTYEENG